MTARPTLLLVDDEPLIRVALSDRLEAEGIAVTAVGTGGAALEEIARRRFDVGVIDLKLPDMTGIDVLRRLCESDGSTDAVIITAHGSIPAAVEAMKLGARDFLTKPFETAELIEAVNRYVRVRRARLDSQMDSAPHPECCGMIGMSPAMRKLFRVIQAVAEGDATILVTGETGTGKELVANAIHSCSARSAGPMVKVNCASIPETLFESELFGAERGAYTGAVQSRKGRFELAHGGTLFLDEVDELPLPLQAKLLRSIQEKEVDRLGAVHPIRVDVRLVAATKVNLRTRVADGRFREDLYYRLNVLPVTLPPLRDREGDLELLVEHFLARAPSNGGGRKRVSEAAWKALATYDWPGNVRELENVVARAVAMSPSELIEPSHFGLDGGDAQTWRVSVPLAQSLQAEEDRRIDAALAQTGGRKAEAAELLGISRKTLWEKLKRRRGSP